MSILSRAKNWYGKFERPISSLSLIGGFVFDALTLKRVDTFFENFWVVIHLAIVTLCIILVNLMENAGKDEANPDKLHFWLVNILQFFFGGLLSTFLVFYFRSSTLIVSWPFLLILAAAFIANESLKRSYERLSFQIGLLFLSIFLFAIYFVPITLHKIGTGVFLISGGVSLLAIFFILLTLGIFSKKRFGRSGRWALMLIAGIFLGMNELYFSNLIPPLPLSLEEATIYHGFTVNGPGNYTALREEQGLLGFFAPKEIVHLLPGTSLYAYTAVFSPTALNTDIVHEWQYFDPLQNTWVVKSRISLAVVGGKDGGYRTYSMKSLIVPGSWRVNVLTLTNQVIGRLDFDVVRADTEPLLKTETIGGAL